MFTLGNPTVPKGDLFVTHGGKSNIWPW